MYESSPIAETPSTLTSVRFEVDADGSPAGGDKFSPTFSTSSSSSTTLVPVTPPFDVHDIACDEGDPLTLNTPSDHEYFLHSRLTLDGQTFYWDLAKNPIFCLRNTVPWDEPFAVRIDGEGVIGAPAFHFRFSDKLGFPWEIACAASDGKECSIRDVFMAIYRSLDKLASRDAAMQLPKDRRRIVFDARTKRCRDLELDPTKEPLKRVDFLGLSRRFFGVSPAKMPQGCFMIQADALIAVGVDD